MPKRASAIILLEKEHEGGINTNHQASSKRAASTGIA